MKKIFIIITILTTALSFAKDYKPEYLKMIQNKEFKKLATLLKEWEQKKPKDPEMFIAYFNYFIYKNSQSGMMVNKDDSGQSLGVLHEKTLYNEKDVRIAIKYLDKGLKLYPQRLDMHFGKINMLGEINDYNNQKKHMIEVLNILPKYKNKWKWTEGEKLNDSDNVILNNYQNRIHIYFNINSSKTNAYIMDTCKKLVEVYPKTIWAYNYIGAIYLKEKKYNESIKYFKLAEKIDSKDFIVINNIAYLYELQKKYDNAEKYYKKLIEFDDQNIKARGIQGLKNIGRYKPKEQ